MSPEELDELLLRPVVRQPWAEDIFPEANPIGKKFGAYEVTASIGEGGMSSVYLGCRADRLFEKRVAIKLLWQRSTEVDFGCEWRLLGRLEHPNIARILDAGVTPDGIAYIVMEYVEGTHIHQYCRERGLSDRGIAELFLHVCDAVSFAHSRLVVHQDLKPGNILVDGSGNPVLIDFGVSQILNSDDNLRTHRHHLTPEYASPEQLSGDAPISIASDIYSLGRILDELARAAVRVVRPDLRGIVEQCCREDPDGRYSCVSELRRDLERYLAIRPVSARGGAPLYRSALFLRRGRRTLAVVSLALAMVAAAVLLIARGERARRERTATLRSFAGPVLNGLAAKVHDVPGGLRPAYELRIRSAQYLSKLLEESPGDAELQTELLDVLFSLGSLQGYPSWENMGDPAGSLKTFGRALQIAEGLHQAHPENELYCLYLIHALNYTGTMLAESGDPSAAMAALTRARELNGIQQPKWRDVYSLTLTKIGELLTREGRFDEAKALHDQAVSIRDSYLRSDPKNFRLVRGRSIALLGRAQTLVGAHRYTEALTDLDQIRAGEQAFYKADPVNRTVKWYLARTDEATAFAEAALGRCQSAKRHITAAAKAYSELHREEPDAATHRAGLERSKTFLASLASAGACFDPLR